MKSPMHGRPATVFLFASFFMALAGVVAQPPSALAVSNTVVISQVYGGGGNSGATYTNDFVELHNRADVAVSLAGWTIQYASAAGSTWSTTALSGSIAPGGYYLIQEAQGAGGTTPLPTPDASGTIAMSATSAKVALVNNGTALSGTCPSSPNIVDLVGYGAASCAEGVAASALTNTTAAIRNVDGCQDTDINLADFTEAGPTPRNTTSPVVSCYYPLNITVDPVASGSVSRAPDQPAYLHGTTVNIAAVPVSGFHFLNWTGDATGTASPVTVLMNGPRSVTAHFESHNVVNPVVISQIYGGGGNTGAIYTHDFVELFNRSNFSVDITGWTIQYASATGSTWETTTLLGTIAPGGYYLIQEAQGPGGTTSLPAPDAIGTIGLSASDGKVALVNGAAVLSGNCPSDPRIVDLVGYGGADCSETAPAVGPDNTTVAMRNEAGCQDTGDNAFNFAEGSPSPRNGATPTNICTIWLGVGDSPALDFTLGPLAPNPMLHNLRVHFSLARAAEVRLRVIDLQGRVTATLAEGMFPPGRHQVTWDGTAERSPAASGVYFVRLDVSGRSAVQKFAITR